ncbi:CheY-like chemotaxis protein [Bradyrhizobium japonicum]|uniref:response regulator n=1 Tax=Bradyrhizobium japonicum TaxID=375 RepID=UPI00339904E8
MPHKLLFVEDNPSQVILFSDALKDWNASNAMKQFELETADTYQKGFSALNNSRFDGALLDLRLPDGSGRFAGQELAKVCVSQLGIPAAIISGEPADYDPAAGNGLLAVFNKGDSNSYDDAIGWFGGLWHMMSVLAGTRRQIQKLGAQVFSRQVWPRWTAYEALAGISDEQLVGIVARQYTSHIADILGIDSPENVKWHPFENYIQPALQLPRPHTGDIFKLDGNLWIVLTPQCDMATQKAPTVLLAACDSKPDIQEWKNRLSDLKQGSNSKQQQAEKFFRNLINQAEPAVHFLPPLVDGQPLLVDFKNLRTLPWADLQARLADRFASVASPFLANLTQRFGAYVSRVGQPNIDTSHLT